MKQLDLSNEMNAIIVEVLMLRFFFNLVGEEGPRIKGFISA